MNEESKAILEKEGWYEGRKIDITEMLKYYNNENMDEIYRKNLKLEVFPKAKEFLEEFGDIIIKGKKHPYHIFDLGRAFKWKYYPKYAEEISILLNQKTLVIGMCSGGMNIIYIIESGQIYDSYGYLAKDIYEMWDSILETIPESEMPGRTWEQLGLVDRLSKIELEVFEKYEEQEANK
jgi:hypothetical protein